MRLPSARKDIPNNKEDASFVHLEMSHTVGHTEGMPEDDWFEAWPLASASEWYSPGTRARLLAACLTSRDISSHPGGW
jgi:hypothetical protein